MPKNSQCNAIKIYSCDSLGSDFFVPAHILFYLKDSFQFAHQPDNHSAEHSWMFLGGYVFSLLFAMSEKWNGRVVDSVHLRNCVVFCPDSLPHKLCEEVKFSQLFSSFWLFQFRGWSDVSEMVHISQKAHGPGHHSTVDDSNTFFRGNVYLGS